MQHLQDACRQLLGMLQPLVEIPCQETPDHLVPNPEQHVLLERFHAWSRWPFIPLDQAGQGRVQGARAGVPLAPKELRSSFCNHLPPLGAQLGRGAQVGRLRHAALVDAGARAGLRQGLKERSERLSAAAVQVATDFAAGFK